MEERVLKELRGGPLYYRELAIRLGRTRGLVKALYALEDRGIISSEMVVQPTITEADGVVVHRRVRQWRLAK